MSAPIALSDILEKQSDSTFRLRDKASRCRDEWEELGGGRATRIVEIWLGTRAAVNEVRGVLLHNGVFLQPPFWKEPIWRLSVDIPTAYTRVTEIDPSQDMLITFDVENHTRLIVKMPAHRVPPTKITAWQCWANRENTVYASSPAFFAWVLTNKQQPC